MSNTFSRLSSFVRVVLVCGLAALSWGRLTARVLDDFNDNLKSDWADFTFIDGFGLPTETGGQFRFSLPAAGQDIFTASQKISEVFELKEGRTLEFSVDLVDSSGEDSYAVLAFIPNTGGNGPGTLGGYGLAKDPTDVLITKGIEKYFVSDDGVSAELPNTNIRLVLTMSVANGAVTVTGKVVNLADEAVLWEQTVVDTAGADVMASGTDDPAAPWITTGYFTLYCYEQFNAAISSYYVHYDNAQVSVRDVKVLDDFNDNAKTDWSDFTFVENFGLPTETGGRFVFDLPPAGQDIFTASQKVSEEITLTAGETYELRVDLVESSGEDAYAVLAFIPNTGGNTPGTLGGYGLAKDPTDVLITKGVQKYFVADDGVTAEVSNENVTLSLTLEVGEDRVTVTGRVIDQSDDSVLWERTVVDTTGADVMEDGTDDPPAPFITSGYFTLYCYQQFNAAQPNYQVVYDNAVLIGPPLAENTAPIISEIQPAAFANFLPSSTVVSFKVVDDKDLPVEGLAVVLNGVRHDTSHGLVVAGSGGTRNVSLAGLQGDVNYTAVLEAQDSEGLVTRRTLYFDTFLTSHRVIEVEDYNYEAGGYINDPIPGIEGVYSPDGYSLQYGTEEIDFHDTRAGASVGDNPYREPDGARTAYTRDFERAKYVAAGGKPAYVFDYDIIDIAADEWLNYTRNFTAGSYEVYLRQALANMPGGAESRLELVTSSPTGPVQTTQLLGTFQGELTGFQYRNFQLTDASGSPVVVTLNGVRTLRLRQVTPDPADGARLLNYLVFVPVPDPGEQRATVISVIPNNGSTVRSVRPVIQATLLNRDTAVKVNTVALALNGVTVPATVTPTADGANLEYAIADLPPSGAANTGVITFLDTDDVEVRKEWQFVVEYTELDPANRVLGTGQQRGFNVRMVQAPPGTVLDDSLRRAEEQLAPNSTIPIDYETNVVDQLINYSQTGPGSQEGSFADDAQFPGVDPIYSSDLIALEATAYLELEAGTYRLGTRCDDGYQVQAVESFTDVNEPPLAFWNDPANATYDFVVTEPGLYPFRLVFFEQSGAAHLEWFSQDLESGVRTLLNASGSPIKAWAEVEALAAFDAPVLSGGQLTLSWTGSGTLQEASSIEGPWAVSANQTNPQTLPVGAGSKFFRIAP